MLLTYAITQADEKGPFLPLPAEVQEKAKMKRLGFETPEEGLGEKFHISPKLLAELNPGKNLDAAGERISVPNVRRGVVGVAVRVVVSKSKRTVIAYGAGGKELAQYPTTIGDSHDPLPIGHWTIVGIAHALVHRDIDYIVKNGAIEMVDEFKGRIALERRWPAGLHTAIEAKEGVAAKSQGMILGQITLQHLVALYPMACGMTGTAATQSLEFLRVYGLRVETIPTNRPMIRVDHPDMIFATKAEKEQAVAAEIRRVHATGQPVLVGTASVAASERLSGLLGDVPHEVLNARHDEREAAIIARAGERGAVTVSTNMAGRGTDIRLGEGVVELGGLYVIGTNKHESRRIDNQLRGRAGRQGDPGSSRFFLSTEDDLMVRYGELDARYREDPDTLQRLIEGQHLDTRVFLHGYEVPFEGQRNKIHAWRQEVLEGDGPERQKHITLRTIDDVWADHLARVSEYRAGVHWVSWAGRDPHREYLLKIHEWFGEMEAALPGEIARRVESDGAEIADRGAVWTYLTTDQPFERWKREFARRLPFLVAAYWGMGA